MGQTLPAEERYTTESWSEPGGVALHDDLVVGVITSYSIHYTKLYDLLLLIDRHLKRSGVVPSFDEMKDALGLKSKSGIHRLITSLEERGFIRRLPHRARALEILKLPEGFIADPEAVAEPASYNFV